MRTFNLGHLQHIYCLCYKIGIHRRNFEWAAIRIQLYELIRVVFNIAVFHARPVAVLLGCCDYPAHMTYSSDMASSSRSFFCALIFFRFGYLFLPLIVPSSSVKFFLPLLLFFVWLIYLIYFFFLFISSSFLNFFIIHIQILLHSIIN